MKKGLIISIFIIILLGSILPLINAEDTPAYSGQAAIDFHNQLYNSMDFISKINWMNTHGLFLFTAEGQNRQCSDTQNFGDFGPATIDPNALCKQIGKSSSLVDIYDTSSSGLSCTRIGDPACDNTGEFCDMSPGTTYYKKCVRDTFKEELRGEMIKTSTSCGGCPGSPFVTCKCFVDRNGNNAITITANQAYEVYCCPKSPCITSSNFIYFSELTYLAKLCPLGQSCRELPDGDVEGNKYTYCTSGSCTPKEMSRTCKTDLSKVYINNLKSDCSIIATPYSCGSGEKCAVTGLGQAECKSVYEKECTVDKNCTGSDKFCVSNSCVECKTDNNCISLRGVGYTCSNNACVYSGGETCNNNGVCDSGETTSNCPADCSGNNTQITNQDKQQPSMTYADWKDASPGMRVKTVCSVDDNCAPYQDLSGTGLNYTVSCVQTQLIVTQLNADYKAVCDTSWLKKMGLTLSWLGASGCIGAISLTAFCAAATGGICAVAAPVTIGICSATASVGFATLTGCGILAHQDLSQGACIAVPKSSSGSFCITSISDVVKGITNSGNCQTNTIIGLVVIIFGGLIILKITKII